MSGRNNDRLREVWNITNYLFSEKCISNLCCIVLLVSIVELRIIGIGESKLKG